MTAYWVARAKVNNPEEYKKYTDLVPAIIERFGGRILARGGDFQILEGSDHFHRFVVIEFPSMEQAVTCHRSAEYQNASAFRRNGIGDNELVIVQALASSESSPASGNNQN